jgi:hypothetical protein
MNPAARSLASSWLIALRLEVVEALLNRLRFRLDTEGVSGDLMWYAWHAGGLPSENVGIFVQKMR